MLHHDVCIYFCHVENLSWKKIQIPIIQCSKCVQILLRFYDISLFKTISCTWDAMWISSIIISFTIRSWLFFWQCTIVLIHTGHVDYLAPCHQWYLYLSLFHLGLLTTVQLKLWMCKLNFFKLTKWMHMSSFRSMLCDLWIKTKIATVHLCVPKVRNMNTHYCFKISSNHISITMQW